MHRLNCAVPADDDQRIAQQLDPPEHRGVQGITEKGTWRCCGNGHGCASMPQKSGYFLHK
jgi:hypothetical protein